MKKFSVIAWVLSIGLFLIGNANADFEADKKECVTLCEAAAKMIKDEGVASAICEINKKDGKYVKGDIYVFLQTMDGICMAHPTAHKLIGKNLSTIPFTDKNGKKFYNAFINIAKDKGSGWVDYMWPKPGENKPSEKSTYILKVEGTDFLVGSGVYK